MKMADVGAKRRTKLEEWSMILDDQKKWIEDHGGTREVYIERYGSKDDPEHFGDGGEAIWEADMAALAKYQEHFDKAVNLHRRATSKIPGVCVKCGRQFVDLKGAVKGCVVHNVESPLSIQERIDIGVYENTKPYSSLKNGFGKLMREEYRAEEQHINEEFRSDLEEAYGMKGHPKAQKVWDLAWEDGHSSGYSEIAIYYDKYVELVK